MSRAPRLSDYAGTLEDRITGVITERQRQREEQNLREAAEQDRRTEEKLRASELAWFDALPASVKAKWGVR